MTLLMGDGSEQTCMRFLKASKGQRILFLVK